MLTRNEKKILNFLQKGLPVKSYPYKEFAGRINISEEKLIAKIKKLKRKKYIRRFGAVLNHHKVGLTANCMCVWSVPDKKVLKIAEIAKTEAMISHCYLRKSMPRWPYNFYTMIHGKTKSDCISLIKKIAKKTKVNEFCMLFTEKQFKKTSSLYKS